MSSATALVLVEMALGDTMGKELMGMRSKKNWRKTILELDDEIDLKQMLFWFAVHKGSLTNYIDRFWAIFDPQPLPTGCTYSFTYQQC